MKRLLLPSAALLRGLQIAFLIHPCWRVGCSRWSSRSLLAFTTSLPVAVVALVVVGGPAGVGSTMLFAHLRHSGATPANIVNTRATPANIVNTRATPANIVNTRATPANIVNTRAIVSVAWMP